MPAAAPVAAARSASSSIEPARVAIAVGAATTFMEEAGSQDFDDGPLKQLVIDQPEF